MSVSRWSSIIFWLKHIDQKKKSCSTVEHVRGFSGFGDFLSLLSFRLSALLSLYLSSLKVLWTSVFLSFSLSDFLSFDLFSFCPSIIKTFRPSVCLSFRLSSFILVHLYSLHWRSSGRLLWGSAQVKKAPKKLTPQKRVFFCTNNQVWTGLRWQKPFLPSGPWGGHLWAWGAKNLRFPFETNFGRKMQFFDLSSFEH